MINMFGALKGKGLRETVWKDPTHPANWQEDFPHDNGQYLNRCVGPCGGTVFLGHKRRVICKVCDSVPPTPMTMGTFKFPFPKSQEVSFRKVWHEWNVRLQADTGDQLLTREEVIEMLASAENTDKLREKILRTVPAGCRMFPAGFGEPSVFVDGHLTLTAHYEYPLRFEEPKPQ